jgi:Tol biopolymer transport system component
MGLWVVGLDGKEPKRILQEAGVNYLSACWSPDGKRLAVVLGKSGQLGGRLEVMDPDGQNRREIKLGLDKLRGIDHPDWR